MQLKFNMPKIVKVLSPFDCRKGEVKEIILTKERRQGKNEKRDV